MICDPCQIQADNGVNPHQQCIGVLSDYTWCDCGMCNQPEEYHNRKPAPQVISPVGIESQEELGVI